MAGTTYFISLWEPPYFPGSSNSSGSNASVSAPMAGNIATSAPEVSVAQLQQLYAIQNENRLPNLLHVPDVIRGTGAINPLMTPQQQQALMAATLCRTCLQPFDTVSS